MLGSTALCTRSQRQGVTVSVLAISLEAEEGTDLGVEVDVTDREAQQKFKEDFGRLPTVEKVDIASVDAQDKIEAALAGCSSSSPVSGTGGPLCPVSTDSIRLDGIPETP